MNSSIHQIHQLKDEILTIEGTNYLLEEVLIRLDAKQ